VRRAQLEVCVDTAAGLASCQQAGVDRIELCSALVVGGLTPSRGFMQLAGSRIRPELAAGQDTQSARYQDNVEGSRPKIMAMIRPRAGHFCFSELEVQCMCDDIEAARRAGLDGVVLGAATATGTLDLPVLSRLCQVAEGMQLTLHRVIDLLDDPLLAMDQAIDLGFNRILTSGGAVTVSAGLLQLTEMQKYAAQRIQIMAGAGLTPALARLIRAETGIEAFHASCRHAAVSDDRLSPFGFGDNEGGVDPGLIEQYRGSLADV